MNGFKSLRLGTKLTIAFLMVALVTVVVGVVAVYQLRQVDAMMSSMYTDRLVPIRDLSHIETELVQHYRRIYVSLAINTPEEITSQIEKNRGSEKAIDEEMAAYKQTELVDEEKRLLAAYDKASPAYRDSASQVLKLLQEGKKDEADNLVRAQTKPLFESLAAAASGLVEINTKVADEVNRESTRIVEQIKRVMIGLIIAGFVLAVLIGTLITRIITRQVGGEPDKA
ncbi:MCP four helix bundle domain-containing protein, partial [Chitinolyticbacter albus]|uniref:MCP four helix bundle domain-containing protein n=1 Tax=Chitinolyticbacter albus TaxID=2961951 RepID=UPI00210BEAC7